VLRNILIQKTQRLLGAVYQIYNELQTATINVGLPILTTDRRNGSKQAIIIVGPGFKIHEASLVPLRNRLLETGWQVITRKTPTPAQALSDIDFASTEVINGNGAFFMYIISHGTYIKNQHYIEMENNEKEQKFSCIPLYTLLQPFFIKEEENFPANTTCPCKFIFVDSCSGVREDLPGFRLECPTDLPIPRNTITVFASPPGVNAFIGLGNGPSQLIRAFMSEALTVFNERWQTTIERVIRRGAVLYLNDRQEYEREKANNNQLPNLPKGHEDPNLPVYFHVVSHVTGFPEFSFFTLNVTTVENKQ